MNLEEISEALKNLSGKSFGTATDEIIKEANEAFSFYDFKRLKTISDGLV